jgi:acetyl esterase
MSPLAPGAQDLLDVIAAAGLPPIHSLTVQDARARMRSALATPRPSRQLTSVADLLVPTPMGPLRLRLYRPSSTELPTALFLHGGGWTINDLDTHDNLCRELAARSGWAIASLDYRLAPEHRHPAALVDAYFAYRWLVDNPTATGSLPGYRVIVGESSGGTTAAALSLMLRDLGAPVPTYQILAYPLLDDYARWPSYRKYEHGYVLDRELIAWFFQQFLPADHRPDPYLFPMLAADLSGLPPTLLLTAEFDPLRDEGVAFVERLETASVPVRHIHAEDQMHSFLLVTRAIESADKLLDRISEALAARR